MRALDLYGTVDAVVSVCDGMNYILDPTELLAVFKRVRLFLNPGGLFVFDMNTEYKFCKLLGNRSFEAKTENGAAYELDNQYNEATQINEYHVLFHPQGSHGESFTETHKQRAYKTADIKNMLLEAGFDSADAYHDYTDEAPRPDSPRVTYVARCM
jgi:SAM-dependent methyltransferase